MKLVAATIAAVAAGSLAPVASTVPPRSGLYGVVMRGPIVPVCTAGQPCSAPAKGLLLRFTGNGRTTTTRTRDDGTYRVHLKAGTYAVAAASGRITPTLAHVRRLHFVHVDFDIDTGIR